MVTPVWFPARRPAPAFTSPFQFEFYTDGTLIFWRRPRPRSSPSCWSSTATPPTSTTRTSLLGQSSAFVGKFIIKTDVHYRPPLAPSFTVNATGQLLVDAVNLRVGYVLEDNTLSTAPSPRSSMI